MSRFIRGYEKNEDRKDGTTFEFTILFRLLEYKECGDYVIIHND